MKRGFAISLISAACLLSTSTLAQQYTKDGELALPDDYRQWVFLSSGIGMTYKDAAANPNPPFENVFVNREAYKQFVKNGTWPDKTIILLEIRNSETKVSINKNGRVQSEKTVAIEAHVKDVKKGGWDFYQFADGSKIGKPFAKTADCFTCHQQNGAVDTTFVQFYPTLIGVTKQHGTFKETAH